MLLGVSLAFAYIWNVSWFSLVDNAVNFILSEHL
jgi:hypothetical protein